MDIRSFSTPGLGDSTYLISHEGRGVLVDPQRDVRRFLDAAASQGVRLTHVLETHLHNDYVSGGLQAARETGARLVLPAAAGAAYPHTPAFHQEALAAGQGLSIVPLHTPGHTPEHTSYLLVLEGEPLALFSGGSLLVGSAGRTDLLGNERAHSLAVAQYGSLRRLAGLPEHVELYPTHGEGSFCSLTGAGRKASTIGAERLYNPVLAHGDAEAFAAGQIARLQPYPRYYAAMGPANLFGAPAPSEEPLQDISADVLDGTQGVHVVDIRSRERFAAGHLPGSLHVEMGEQFGVWTGWLVPFDAPIALVAEPGQAVDEAQVQLQRIGYDRAIGVVRLAGVEAGLLSYPTATIQEFVAAYRRGSAEQVLDVRAPAERQAGHIEGSLHCYVPDLALGAPETLSKDTPVWVICGSGYRAGMAASLLEREGFRPIQVVDGGVPHALARLEPQLVA